MVGPSISQRARSFQSECISIKVLHMYEVSGTQSRSPLMKSTSRPKRVCPSPEVMRAIRSLMRRGRVSPQDRLMAAVSATLGAEPTRSLGLNEGIFYPETALPHGLAARAPARAVRSHPTIGEQRLLVLLVDFPDNRGARRPEEFRDMLFSESSYATGSMRDFYKENSYGQLDIEGEVLGWLTLPQGYSYYVNGGSGGDEKAYPHNAKKMVEDALALAAKNVDFRQFDADGDEYLDGLFVVHAGPGAETDPNPTTRTKDLVSPVEYHTAVSVEWHHCLGVPHDSRGLQSRGLLPRIRSYAGLARSIRYNLSLGGRRGVVRDGSRELE
jgi:Immune inhibitor A peptidase M6